MDDEQRSRGRRISADLDTERVIADSKSTLVCPPCKRGDCEECMTPDYTGSGLVSPYWCGPVHSNCGRPPRGEDFGAYDFGIPGW